MSTLGLTDLHHLRSLWLRDVSVRSAARDTGHDNEVVRKYFRQFDEEAGRLTLTSRLLPEVLDELRASEELSS